MLKKIVALASIALIIGSAVAVSATRTVTDSGIWNYGANIFSGNYSNYLDYMHTDWSSSVSSPGGSTTSGWVQIGTAKSQQGYWLLGGNKAYYNFK